MSIKEGDAKTEKTTLKMSLRQKRYLSRGFMFLFLCGLAFWLYYNGKGYTLILDNKKLPESLEIPQTVTLEFSGEKKPVTVESGSKMRLETTGKSYTVKVFEKENEIYRGRIKLKEGESVYVFSLPAFLKGEESAVQPFVPPEKRTFD